MSQHSEEIDLWHAPWPGPEYWSYRCLVCGENVVEHPSWWQRFLHKHFPTRSKETT